MFALQRAERRREPTQEEAELSTSNYSAAWAFLKALEQYRDEHPEDDEVPTAIVVRSLLRQYEALLKQADGTLRRAQAELR